MNIKMSAPEAEAYLRCRHDFWYDVLNRWCLANNVKPPPLPAVMIKYDHVNRAGRYYSKDHACEYTLSYVMVYGKQSDETVAHEMSHAFQKAVSPHCVWHGEIFYFLLRNVCGFAESIRTHSMDTKQARIIGQLVWLHRQATLSAT